MKAVDVGNAFGGNSYPGRGIIMGRSGDAAVLAYFIMGRSESSRNRIFAPVNDGIVTRAYAPGQLENPSLLLYAPVRAYQNIVIVTNGDQTDTVYDALACGKRFEDALQTRAFEPDGPHYTPRISGLGVLKDHAFSYTLSILKRGTCGECLRYYYEYESAAPGEGRLIHTYEGDGNPLPSFEGEPRPVMLAGGIDEMTDALWNALDENNKVSLFVRYIDLKDGNAETRIVNKKQTEA
ncbi:MAG: IMP cyclohydrolase [Oscillospiraceae bacterium]|nr:IMP cyclohydrolase [Oscillospiraceae bacterium]